MKAVNRESGIKLGIVRRQRGFLTENGSRMAFAPMEVDLSAAQDMEKNDRKRTRGGRLKQHIKNGVRPSTHPY